jgi:hypothetical protein
MSAAHRRLDGTFVNNVLLQLFQGHGVKAGVQSGRVAFPNHPG